MRERKRERDNSLILIKPNIKMSFYTQKNDFLISQFNFVFFSAEVLKKMRRNAFYDEEYFIHFIFLSQNRKNVNFFCLMIRA